MRRCKYLEDDLGLKYKGDDSCNSYAWDWDNPNDKQKEQRKLYGFDERECFCLDRTFELWLYAHLKMYLEGADKTIDLTFYKFTVKTLRYEDYGKKERKFGEQIESFDVKKRICEEKELNQKECIDLILEYIEKSEKLSDDWIDADNPDGMFIEPEYEYSQAAVDIWAKIYHAMWW